MIRAKSVSGNRAPADFNIVGAGWNDDRQSIILRAIWRSPLPASQKVLLGVIADLVRQGDGSAPVSYRSLGELCRKDEHSVKRLVKPLVGAGWITIARSIAEHGGRCPNEYALGPQLEQAVREQIAWEIERRRRAARDAVDEKLMRGRRYEDLGEREKAIYHEVTGRSGRDVDYD